MEKRFIYRRLADQVTFYCTFSVIFFISSFHSICPFSLSVSVNLVAYRWCGSWGTSPQNSKRIKFVASIYRLGTLVLAGVLRLFHFCSFIFSPAWLVHPHLPQIFDRIPQRFMIFAFSSNINRNTKNQQYTLQLKFTAFRRVDITFFIWFGHYKLSTLRYMYMVKKKLISYLEENWESLLNRANLDDVCLIHSVKDVNLIDSWKWKTNIFIYTSIL